MPLDDELRAVRAGLSLFTGSALPEPFTGTARAHGLEPGGWVFPDRPGSLSRNELTSLTDLLARGRSLLTEGADRGVRALVPGDPGWPAGAGCDDLPCLWVTGEGDVASLLSQAITVTGARSCSDYGRHHTVQFGYAVAAHGWTVVAAGAFGIDMHAAVGALTDGGRVVLVAAGGVLPEDHPTPLHPLLAQVRASGAVMSACPPGSTPTRARWAVQEQLLGTLSAATVVIEATPTGRALSTAQAAANCGKLVCALPGPASSATSAGSHRLIADGTARLVTTGTEVITMVGAARQETRGTHSNLYEIRGRASWDDGHWHSHEVPRFFVPASSHGQAADVAFDVVYTARPQAFGATLHAAVTDPAGRYESMEITSTH